MASNLGKGFSESGHEKSYHRTNASSIAMMNSFKTLDMPDKDEFDIVPEIKANVDLKYNLELRSSMDNVIYSSFFIINSTTIRERLSLLRTTSSINSRTRSRLFITSQTNTSKA